MNLKGREDGVVGVTQTLRARSLDSAEVQIGTWRSFNLEVSLVREAPADFDSFDGLIGPRALGARRIAFDFENRVFSWD